MRSINRIRAHAVVQERAKELRKVMTPAEKILWERLRNRQLGGFKFRRQHPMGSFIADFYCAECKLVVEIDGNIHISQAEADAERTAIIESFGYRVIRFRNAEVETNLQTVLNKILTKCNSPLLPKSGEGAEGLS
jgi:very-short-patch-repair endonuclease